MEHQQEEQVLKVKVTNQSSLDIMMSEYTNENVYIRRHVSVMPLKMFLIRKWNMSVGKEICRRRRIVYMWMSIGQLKGENITQIKVQSLTWKN